MSIWEVASKVSTPWNLAAFALAVILFVVIKKSRKDIPPALWVVIVLLVIAPIAASVYSQYNQSLSIYRVRLTVLDMQGVLVGDARVWSSMGGEPKRVSGGLQFDIPKATKPADGKLTIFASKESSFLTGKTDIVLKDDYNPTANIILKRDDSAKVRGQVTDAKNRAILGAKVYVVGYESEGIITDAGGNFELPAHASINQQVLLHAEVKGRPSAKLWHPAGDEPAILILNR